MKSFSDGWLKTPADMFPFSPLLLMSCYLNPLRHFQMMIMIYWWLRELRMLLIIQMFLILISKFLLRLKDFSKFTPLFDYSFLAFDNVHCLWLLFLLTLFRLVDCFPLKSLLMILFWFSEVYFKASSKERPSTIREVKASHIGQLVRISGIVTRCSDVKPLMAVAVYTCEDCGHEIYQVPNCVCKILVSFYIYL